MPYGYYSFMRLSISAICIYNILTVFEKKDWIFYFLIGCIILHNPIFKIHFKREEWFPIDIFCGFVFIYLAYIENKKTTL